MLFAVLIAAAILPNLTPKKYPGSAMAEAIPPPPAVGDCMLDAKVAGWYAQSNPAYLSPRLAPCAGVRYGEVMAVIPDGRSAGEIAAASKKITDYDGPVDWGEDVNSDTCQSLIWPYLGLSTVDPDEQPKLLDTAWLPLGGVVAAPAAPSTRQQAGGQHWVACLAVIPAVNGDQMLVDAVTPYSRSMRDALSGGRAPAEMAICLNQADLFTASRVACTTPHRSEAFAFRPTNVKGLTQSGLDTECRKLVSRLTGLADPTVGGRLTVIAQTTHGVEDVRAGLGDADDESGSATCAVDAPATHRLAGALLGLGTSPVPWAH